MPVDKFVRMSDTKTKDTGVSLTYINNNYIRSDGTTPVSGSINMNGNTLYNVSDPVNPQDVATKEYADKVGGGCPFHKENDNYKATNTIDMMYNKLVNIHKPIEPYDAATKDYVDYILKDIREKLEKQRSHIAATANYKSPLRKREFQLAFGGSVNTDSNTGFLVPHSGRIKKIVMRTSLN